jgi:hypothetical protein
MPTHARPCIQKLCNVYYPPIPSLGWIGQIKGRSLSLASTRSISWLAYSLHPRSLTPIWSWMQVCTKLMYTHVHPCPLMNNNITPMPTQNHGRGWAWAWVWAPNVGLCWRPLAWWRMVDDILLEVTASQREGIIAYECCGDNRYFNWNNNLQDWLDGWTILVSLSNDLLPLTVIQMHHIHPYEPPKFIISSLMKLLFILSNLKFIHHT